MKLLGKIEELLQERKICKRERGGEPAHENIVLNLGAIVVSLLLEYCVWRCCGFAIGRDLGIVLAKHPFRLLEGLTELSEFIFATAVDYSENHDCQPMYWC